MFTTFGMTTLFFYPRKRFKRKMQDTQESEVRTHVLELAKEKPPRYQRSGLVAGHSDVRRCVA